MNEHSSQPNSDRPVGPLNFPRLSREEGRELYDRLAQGALCDWDYLVMMALSSTLAALGLLQDATAVVIGAMLVAPLMGPLVAAGLSLVQGNVALFKVSMRSTLAGIGIGFGVSLVIGLLNPGFEPALEIESRGQPDVLDFVIALASGMASAYAFGRPKVVATLAGVAIAAALVPPLVVIGIALTNDRLYVSGSALILLITNLVAIILGAAIVFRMLGIQVKRFETGERPWTRQIIMLLLLISIALSAPLLRNLMKKRRVGQDRALNYPVSAPVRDAVRGWISQYPNIDVITMGRISVEPETGIVIVLSTDRRLHEDFKTQLTQIVLDARGEESPVSIFLLLNDQAAMSSEPRLELDGEGSD
ncbi:MAG: TIGR00341 family protein [Planctomycetota bacterium]|nr:TIGR00341 family protein [Planctomycetota bacterium]